MAKGDAPPLLMKVKDGRMEPVAQFDYERLCSYRVDRDDQGNIIYPRVKVYITQDAATWRRRKYWAILTKVVEAGPTEYRSPDDLHKAVKREIGFVNSTFLSDGKTLKVTLKSTAKLDEPEFRIFYEEAIEALSEMTGIDVETLGKESADVGRDETEQPEVNPASGSGSGETSSPTSDPAPDQSASAADQEDGAEPDGASAGDDAPSSDLDPLKRMLMEECVENILRDAFSEPKDQQAEKVDKMERIFLEPQNLGSHPRFVKLCAETARRIIGKPQERGRAREYLMGKIG